jgi:hypothetical protein
MKNKNLYLAIALLSIFLAGCNRNKEQITTVDIGFSDYISAFTSGIISSQSKIKIVFDKPLSDEQQKRAGKLLSFKPSIKGKTTFPDEHTLVFTPDEHLQSNTRFEATFKLGDLVQVPEKYQSFVFDFKTVPQNFAVEIKGISSYSINDLSKQLLKGEITSADFVKTDRLDGFLVAEQEGKRLPVSWNSTADGRTHYFIIDSVERKENSAEVSMRFQGKAFHAEKNVEKTYDIPPLNVFKVMNVSVVREPDQHVLIRFSDPLDAGQDLRGLVRLEENAGIRFAVSGNVLKIFPDMRIEGESQLKIDKTIKNAAGTSLDAAYQSTLLFETPVPQIAFTGKGSVLPSSKGLVLPFKAVSLKGVNVRIIRIFEKNIHQFFQVNQYGGDDELKRVGRIVYQDDMPLDKEATVPLTQWNTFSLDLAEFIRPEPGAIYQVQLNFDRAQSLYNCPGEAEIQKEVSEETGFTIVENNANDVGYWKWNGFNHVDYDRSYDWRNRDNPCSDAYYMHYNRAVSKNVLASNLGIIAKQGETDELRIFVRDITTTQPVSGVEIEVFNFQKRRVGIGTTDDHGSANVSLKGEGFLVMARKDDVFGYLRIDDGSSLSTSMFDVGGSSAEKGIRGFLYGERDVWRPGDSLFVSLILEDENNILPAKHPVVFELSDPQGRLVSRKVTPLSAKRLFVFRGKTTKEAVTGRYRLKATIGGLVFSKGIRIETIKPNRLKMNLDFGQDMIRHDDTDVEGALSVKWLHGTVARKVKADVEMKMMPAKTTFNRYENYSFTDPTKKFRQQSEMVFDGKVDEDGKAKFSFDIGMDDRAPGFMAGRFRVRAFEHSGEFSTTSTTIKYSPFSHYVGLMVPEGEGWNGALSSVQEHQIPVVTLDEEGEPIARKVNVQVYKMSWEWWWENRTNDDLSRFVASRHGELVDEHLMITEEGTSSYSLKLSERHWGRVFIRITDVESGHSAGQVVMMDYPGWWESNSDDTPGGAAMLSFSLDKEKYIPGDRASLKIPASEGSPMLVSVENSSRILHSEWIEGTDQFTNYSFEVTADMAPNAYVFVSLIQPHNQTANDRPVRLYGVEPLFVEDPQSYLNPQIEMPEELAPGQAVEITVSEEEGLPMEYTLAVVDEGLLDIIAFATPDPRKYFNARRALGVKTWDLYDEVIGAFSGRYAALLKPGGGVEINPDAGDKSANRFKPVVEFFGPFSLNKNATKTHRFSMPNYVGSVRTMVVAARSGRYGSAQETTPVKKALMTLATAPRTIKPGDVMDVPVTVIAMEEGLGEVTVDLKVNEAFVLQGQHQQKLFFNEPGEKIVVFSVKAKEQLGVGTIDVSVAGGGHKAEDHIEMNVLPSNPPVTKATHKTLEPGSTIEMPFKSFGIAGTNEISVEASALVPLNLEKRLDFLITYHHGCIEQVVSGAFPQLYLPALTDLSAARKKKVQDNIISAVNAVKKFQQDNGGMSYWPSANGRVNEWGTNYAGHFLLEARNKGYHVPEELVRSWLSYQQRAARNWSSARNLRGDKELVQAYRLYTMALAGEASAGDMNRLREQEALEENALWRLAAAYALDGKQRVAEKLTGRLATEPKTYENPGPTYGSGLRDMAMILETMTVMGDKERGMTLMREIAGKLSENSWHSTQSAAYALLAVGKFALGMKLHKTINLGYSFNQASRENVVSDKPLLRLAPDTEKSPGGKVSLTNNGQGTLFISLLEKGVPVAGEEEPIRNKLSMEVAYRDLQGNPVDPSAVVRGTDLEVEVKVAHPGVWGDFREMALTQIVPAGWEIRNPRLSSFDSPEGADAPEYRDIRDDRVYTYFDLDRHQTKKFRFKINAAYTGKYYLPGISCKSMYDNSIKAYEPGQWVEVVKPGMEK